MSLNILLIGDSCIDTYTTGKVDRFSPEAPVPVFQPLYTSVKPGMASNVANNFTALGCDVTLLTNKDKGIKTRYIDKKSGYQLLRVDEDIKIQSWDNKLPNTAEYDAVVISDYNKGFLSYEQIERILNDSTPLVFLDTKKKNLSRFNKAIVKVNESEYKSSTTICSNLIVTYGGSHVTFHDEKYTVPKVPVFDVCGAGDTFLAALVYDCCTNNYSIKEAISFAIKASAVTVQHLGVYSPSLKEVKNG